MKKNERFEALQILTNIIKNKTELSHLLAANKDLSPLSKELCFGVCRQYFRLSILADKLLKKRPKEIDLWIILLMGLYQLHYLRIPDYAVVKETVALVENIKKPWAKALVNAILRTYCREEATLIKSLENNEDFIYGHPKWLIKKIQKSWPHHWQDILKANDIHPPMSLRVNTKNNSVDEYLELLEKTQINATKMQNSPSGISLNKPCDVNELPGFSLGNISVQDEAAQLAVRLLDLKPGLRLLDACAAPGGKTCHILETENQLVECIALDIDDRRLNRTRENLTRLKLQATLLKGDGLEPKDWWDGVLFDRILVDAPCSAIGVIRRHPDIKILRTEEDIKSASLLQHDLLESLWPLLAVNGIMVYATCSIMPEENELQISNFLNRHSDAKFLTTNITWGNHTNHGWQIFPGENNMDGFFYSRLIKTNI